MKKQRKIFFSGCIGYIIVTIIFATNNLYAQKETWNWFFGDKAGITFMPDGKEAKFLQASNISIQRGMQEGIATISDRKGNLLFYSDGIFVWNKNHSILSNLSYGGLFGNTSSARNVIIIPKPLSNRFYYVFTIDAYEGREDLSNPGKAIHYGLRYSVLDVLAGNQGDIDPNQKNILLVADVFEKMITINHSNESDVWLVTYSWKNNDFYIYLITKDGIQSPKRIKNPLPPMQPPPGGGNPTEAANLDYDIENKKLINCDWESNSFVIFDFNPATGNIDVDNYVAIPAYPADATEKSDQDFFRPYSGIFSKDGTKFYGSCFRRSLVQYDFSLNEIDDIIASRTVIADSNTEGVGPNNFQHGYRFGAIRRGPDDRIYVARMGIEYLGIIDKPELKGLDCDFQLKGIYLEGARAGYGLPIMMNYTFPPCVYAGYAGGDKSVCVGNEIILGDVATDTANMTFEWNPKDYLDNPYSLNPVCKPQKTMQYILTITNTELNCFDFDTITVTLQNPPTILKSNDVEICVDASVNIGNPANSDNLRYEWNPKAYLATPYSKVSKCTPIRDMQYILSATDTVTGCVSYDTVNVKIKTIDDIKISGSDFICDGVSTELKVDDEFVSYLWSTGETTKSITVEEAGEYSVTVTDLEGCTGTKTITVKYLASDNFSIVAPKIICVGTSVVLSTNANFSKYLWSTGETTPTITIQNGGNYWVTVENENGCKASDTAFLAESYISYSLSQNEINYGNICLGSLATKNIEIANTGSDDFIISNIRFSNFSDDYFRTGNLTFPIDIKNDSQKIFNIIFEPNSLGDFADTLLIEISEPCSAILKIPLFGTSADNHFALSSQDFKVEPGNKIQIPVKIDFLTNTLSTNPQFDFTFDFSYRWDIVQIFAIANGTITNRTKNGEIETIKIAGIFPANSNNFEIFLSANTTIGGDYITSLEINNFSVSLDCSDFDFSQNEVELIGCAIRYRILKFFNPTDIAITVEDNLIICDVFSEEEGEFILTLYDYLGVEVAQKVWQKNDLNFMRSKIFFETKNYSSGLYLASLRTRNNFLTRKIIFTK